MTTTAHDPPTLDRPSADRRPDPQPPTPDRRAVLPAAAAYVAAWLAGLAVLPEAVDPHADAGSIGRYLAAHAGAAVLQSWLVHGVAAVALVLVRPVRPGGAGRRSRGRRPCTG